MKKYFISILILCNLAVLSQTDSTSKINHYPIKIKKNTNNFNLSLQKKKLQNLFLNTDLNILMGGTQFFGDIKQNDWLPAYDKNNNFSEIQAAIEISLTKKINPIISLQASAIMGRFGGMKKEKIGENYTVYEPYPGFYEGNGEYFITDFKELDMNLLLNLSNASSFFTNYNIDKYVFHLKGGIGLNIFNSINRNIGSDNYIYSWGYEEGVFEQNDNFIKKEISNSPKEIVYIYGLIAKYEINDQFSIILDVTKRRSNTDLWDSHDNNANDDNFNFYAIGTSYNIGGKSENKEWVTPLEGMKQDINNATANIEWLSKDSDSDGVSDLYDKEPNTPIGVAVDGSGISLDVDMDNVPDYIDQDPFSSRGAIVDERGVEYDSDNDGVYDSKDLENNTEIGSMVNQYGITISPPNITFSANYYFPSIFFENNSYYIDKSNLQKLATVAVILEKNPHIKLSIIGNTNNLRSKKSNKRLAKKRAKEVANYLSSNFGINRSRLKVRTNGEDEVISKKINISEKNMININYLNRRVDFEITY